MSVKGQLHACRDVLMVAMKKAERFNKQQAVKLIRGCLDLVEHMEHKADKLTHAELDMTLTVLNQAAKEVDDKSADSVALVGAMKNAIGRLESLRTEIPVV
ncbi:MAG TPA: hypothetical protein VGY57_02980 [Vicinamibacterales bacterium]|jgi:hypothetical protein|nr:hypothetical protein [Vicinamibacterales bacterium]